MTDIAFICPNGQAMTVNSYPRPGTNLGVPVIDDPPEPGTVRLLLDSEATLDTWANGGRSRWKLAFGHLYGKFWGTLDGCPRTALGNWKSVIFGLDNGFVFEWGGLPTLYPVTQSFTPQFGLECDSTFWTSTNQGEHGVPSGNGIVPLGVTMSTPTEPTAHHQQFRLQYCKSSRSIRKLTR